MEWQGKLVLAKTMRAILFVQGIYYLITGIWPLISLRTFEAVTGPKTDDWLVQTVGVLAAVIGATLVTGSRQTAVSHETLTLAVLSAIGFTTVDVVFVASGTISPIYLADAVAEAVILGLLSVTALTRQH